MKSATIQKYLDPQEIVNFVKGKQTDLSNLQHIQNLEYPIIGTDSAFQKDIQLLGDKSESQSSTVRSKMALAREVVINKCIELVTAMNSLL